MKTFLFFTSELSSVSSVTAPLSAILFSQLLCFVVKCGFLLIFSHTKRKKGKLDNDPVEEERRGISGFFFKCDIN